MEKPFDPAAARAAILERIAKAAIAAGRAPESVTLVAVSKQQDDARVEAVLATGQRVFGENKVQEAQARWLKQRTLSSPQFDGARGANLTSDALARRQALPDLQLRLIGPLQSNKAREAVALFDAIDSLDRPKLAQALATEVQRAGRCPELLIQINTGEEPQKAGIAPLEADAFIAEVRTLFGAQVRGLMCIPPAEEPPGPHFALLAKIAARNGLTELSMGMSGDFETAIRFGATQIRVGMALFGPRDLT